MIKNVILDMGNTLLKFDPNVSLNKFCSSEEEKVNVRKALFDSKEWILGDKGEISDKDRFDKVRQKLSHYKLTCKALEDYIKLFNNFIEAIKNNSLTEQHFKLMSINYEYKYTGKNKLDKYIYYLNYWQEDKNKLEQDYTDKFTEIVNSKDFHELYE